MKSDNLRSISNNSILNTDSLTSTLLTAPVKSYENRKTKVENTGNQLSEIVCITSFPPRVCGIATYSQDLIAELKLKFGSSFDIKVCALESGKKTYKYNPEVTAILDTSDPRSFSETA